MLNTRKSKNRFIRKCLLNELINYLENDSINFEKFNFSQMI